MKKNTFVAAFLNFIAPGAGYLYIGYLKKAIIAYFIFLSFFPFGYALAYHIPGIYLTIFFLFLLISMYIYIIYDVVKLCKSGDVKETQYKFSKWYFVLLFVLLFMLGGVAIAQISPYSLRSIVSSSMNNTLIQGDAIIIKKNNGYVPSRGEIVVFKYPLNQKVLYIDRCVAKENDFLFIVNKDLYIHLAEGNDYMKKVFDGYEMIKINNYLWVKNPYMKSISTIIHDPAVTPKGNYPKVLFRFGPIQIPKGKIFVLGDNRDHSNDSRFWGLVDTKDILSPVHSIFVNFKYFNRSGLLIE